MPLDAPGRGPLVGRDEELARLVAAAGVGADGGLVVLSGDAGIGKTRLLAELAARAREEGWRVVVGHCLGEAGTTVPHLPFTEVLSRLATEVPDALAAALADHPGARRLTRSADDPEVSGRGTVPEDVLAVLSALARTEPLLVVVEDVHWADAATRDLLTLLLTRGFDAPVGLVVSLRGEDLHRRHPLRPTLAHWARLPGVARLELGPLARGDVSTLVKRLDDAISTTDLTSVVDRAEGNAFFAEELAAAGRLGHRGTGEDLSRLLLVRLDQLEDAAQMVVRTASAAGRRTNHALLAQVVGVPEDRLDAALRQAVEHHVLVPDGTGYAFRHALLAETVYDDLLPGERVRTHEAYAAVLAEQPGLAPAADLARHAAEAGLRDLAIDASIRAGSEAMALGGPQEALAHYERALRLVPSDPAVALRATLSAAAAATDAGRPDHAVALLQERLESAGDVGPARAELLAAAARTLRVTENDVDTELLTREAVELVADEGDTALRAVVLSARAQALADQLQHENAEATGAEAARIAELVGLPEVAIDVRAAVARLRERRGEREASLEDLERSLATATPGVARIRLLHHVGGAHHRAGRLAQAREFYGRGVAEARDLGRAWAPYALDCWVLGALVAYEAGDWDAAVALADTRDDPDPPPVAAALLQAVALMVAAARGEPGTLEAVNRLRAHWEHEGMLVVSSTGVRMEVLGHVGDLDGSRTALAECGAMVRRLWAMRTYEAQLRLNTLLVGQLATAAASAPASVRVALREEGEGLFVEAHEVWTKAVRNHNDGPEATAWWARAEAEAARLRWLTDDADTDPADLVAAWDAAVLAFETYGHVYEVARCRWRRAEAHAAAGDQTAARADAEAARAVAEQLGAVPLLEALRPLLPATRGRAEEPTADEVALTPREHEVLELVALGRSNKEVGERLFISTKTVSVHVSNILAKLGASGRGEAAAIARDRGLLGE